MKATLLVLSLGICSLLFAQNRPSVKKPVVLSAEVQTNTVAPGQKSAVVVTFKIPRGIWLGAKPSEARFPAGTRINTKTSDFISTEAPVFPEPDVEGIPVKLGITKVYDQKFTVIIPYTVAGDAPEGEQEIKLWVTYTPAFSAGKLPTHVDQPLSAKVTIAKNAANLPPAAPTRSSVPEDFIVKEKNPFTMVPMMVGYNEGTAFSKIMHRIYLDPPNHGKKLKHVMYPYLTSSIQSGTNTGLGLALLNSTREGVMTGTLSVLGYHNEFLGATFGVDLITCPAAYHNMQTTVRFTDGDYTTASLKYEYLGFDPKGNWGFQIRTKYLKDPRFRFYGVGAGSKEEDAAVYENEQFSGIADLFYMPFNFWRFGLGYNLRLAGVNDPLDELVNEEGFPSLENTFPNLTGQEGSTVTGPRFSLIFDHRNQEFNPTNGFYGRVTTSYNFITEDNGADLADNYVQVQADMRQYISTVDQAFTLLMRGGATYTNTDRLPFYELASLGGPASIRAFDINRFRDQHAVFGSVEMRYSLAKMTIFGFPMTLQMGGFLDVGQVFNDFSNFNGRFNVAPGGSVRFVNYPNVGYILNVAHGQDGVYVNGGITLPF